MVPITDLFLLPGSILPVSFILVLNPFLNYSLFISNMFYFVKFHKKISYLKRSYVPHAVL
jgi:hypothetical protein